MKILITAFEPFGNDKINPTMEVVSKLEDIEGVEILVLPVTFTAFDFLQDNIRDKYYDYIIHLGQAGGRNKITFEKVAINYMDAKIPDNLGNQPMGEDIVNDGPQGLFTTIPIKELVSALKAKNFPVNISYTAGTYVCNYIMYSSLQYFNNSNTKVGFVHIPYSPEQVSNIEAPSMDTSLVSNTLREAIQLLKTNELPIAKMSLGETD